MLPSLDRDRVGARDVFVDVRAPTGPRRQDEFAVLDAIGIGQQLRPPRHLVHVDLHHAQVRHDRAEMSADDRGKRPAGIVRRDVHLVGVGHRRHPQRFGHAIPLHVDDRHIDGLLIEVVAKAAATEHRFERADRRRGRLPDQAQRLRLVKVHLEPHQVERLDLSGNLAKAFWLVVKIEIDREPHSGPAPSRSASSCDDDRSITSASMFSAGKSGPPARPRSVQSRAILVEDQHIGLQRLEAARRATSRPAARRSSSVRTGGASITLPNRCE